MPESTPPARKKRIPKACGSCRVSKVKCDGLRPCSRCHALRKVCEFVERPKDPHESIVEALESEVEALKAQVNNMTSNSLPSPSTWPGPPGMPVGAAGASLSWQRHDAIAVVPMGREQVTTGYIRPPSPISYGGGSRGTFSSLHRTPSNATVSPVSDIAGGPIPIPIPDGTRLAQAAIASASITSNTGSQKKRSRAHFEAGTPPTIPDLDPIGAGLMTVETAQSYFHTFFSGCNRYVPVFDPLHDTFESVRSRSTLLFSVICSVGCRVMTGAESHQTRRLGLHAQRMVNVAVAAPTRRCGLETVQALLVRACYTPERSLLVAVATRMAIEIGIPEAYGVLSTWCVANAANPRVGSSSSDRVVVADDDGNGDTGATLMRKTRTWLHLLMMGQILHVDAGGAPGFRFRGAGAAQRCRILLNNNPFSTDMDLYLFSQVELNALRTRIHSALSHYYVRTHNNDDEHDDDGSADDDEIIMGMVADARIDINVWFDDWTRIYERHTARMPWLAPNLAVQRCWADSMAMCAALRTAGIENVRAMSATQRAILRMAKRSLWQHLDIILQEPRVYLRSIRYAMDFVWAKNAFCYLLLLKLSLLLPDDDDEAGSGAVGDGGGGEELVEKGRMLVEELRKAGGGLDRDNRDRGAARNSTSSLYFHLVRVSIDKFSHAIRSRSGRSQSGQPVDAQAQNGAAQQGRGSGNEEEGWPPDESQTELESFVPEEFVFEWDFPGLTFFSSPTQETGWLDELLASSAFDGSGNTFYSLGWTSMNLNLV
ncbi:hypothetical protein B0J18DRAFT_403218 [Chaetomium sp. MPI-SDFR-AT-0129]|nr:hypothetical protein B0J18DRAFT_403218 [Chaetomium sp. MPI-SDFR-AT-0129]